MIYKSPVNCDCVEPHLDKSLPVILYGLKIEGLVIFHWLKDNGYKVSAIVSDENSGARYFGVPVIKEDDLSNFSHAPSQVLLAVKFKDAFCTRVQRLNLKEILLVPALSLLNRMDVDIDDIPLAGWFLAGTKRQSEKAVKCALNVFVYECSKLKNGMINIPTLDLVVTERCSLKCRDCSNLMQYYRSPKDYEIADLLSQFSVISRVADNIGDVHVLGGEPFLYRNLSSLILQLAEFKNSFGRLKLFTNGTIVPPVRLLEVLSDNETFVSVSDYGLPVSKIPALFAVFHSYGIEFEIKEYKSWQKCGFLISDLSSHEKLKEKFDSCCAKDLLTLQDGKIFLCPFISNAVRLGAVSNESEYSICADSSLTRKKLFDFLNTPGWKSGICRNCPGRGLHAEKVKPAVQAKAPLSLRIMR